MELLQAHRDAEQEIESQNVERVEHLIIPKACKVDVKMITERHEDGYETTLAYECNKGSYQGGRQPVGTFPTIAEARAAVVTEAGGTCIEVAEALVKGGYLSKLPEKFAPPEWKKDGDCWVFDPKSWFIIRAHVEQGMMPGPWSATCTVDNGRNELIWETLPKDYADETIALDAVLVHIAEKEKGKGYARVLKPFCHYTPDETEQAEEPTAMRADETPPVAKRTGAYYDSCREKMESDGYESLGPCEQCTVSTVCEKCCKTCEDPCNAKQACRKDTLAEQKRKSLAAAMVHNDLTNRRSYHHNLAEICRQEGNQTGSEQEDNVVEYYDRLIERVERDIDGYQEEEK